MNVRELLKECALMIFPNIKFVWMAGLLWANSLEFFSLPTKSKAISTMTKLFSFAPQGALIQILRGSIMVVIRDMVWLTLAAPMA